MLLLGWLLKHDSADVYWKSKNEFCGLVSFQLSCHHNESRSPSSLPPLHTLSFASLNQAPKGMFLSINLAKHFRFTLVYCVFFFLFFSSREIYYHVKLDILRPSRNYRSCRLSFAIYSRFESLTLRSCLSPLLLVSWTLKGGG